MAAITGGRYGVFDQERGGGGQAFNIIIILKLLSYKGPYEALSPSPVKESQWGIEPPTLYLNHGAVQQSWYELLAKPEA